MQLELFESKKRPVCNRIVVPPKRNGTEKFQRNINLYLKNFWSVFTVSQILLHASLLTSIQLSMKELFLKLNVPWYAFNSYRLPQFQLKNSFFDFFKALKLFLLMGFLIAKPKLLHKLGFHLMFTNKPEGCPVLIYSAEENIARCCLCYLQDFAIVDCCSSAFNPFSLPFFVTTPFARYCSEQWI